MAHWLNSFLRNFGNQAVDLLWPRITGIKESPPVFDEQPPDVPPELLDTVELMLSQRITQAENRMVTVDRKLLPIFRLTSLLATLVTALLAGAASLIPGVQQDERTLAWAAIGLILYMMVQLICAVNSTIGGLEASRYASQTKATLIPLRGERANDYRRRQFRDVIYVTEQHEWATNLKVSHMKVAYRAIRNTVLPLVGLIAVATTLAYMKLHQ